MKTKKKKTTNPGPKKKKSVAMAPKAAKKSAKSKTTKPAKKAATKVAAKPKAKTKDKVKAKAAAAPKDKKLKKASPAIAAPKSATKKAKTKSPVAPKEGKSSKKDKKTASVSVEIKQTVEVVAQAVMEDAPKAKKGKSKKGSSAGSKSLQASSMSSYTSTFCGKDDCGPLVPGTAYCRLCYIVNWKKIKKKERILREGKLNQYIEELVNKYPDKYIEAIQQDLSSEDDFSKVILDLDLEENADDFDNDDDSNDLIDSIRRGFDDEGEDY